MKDQQKQKDSKKLLDRELIPKEYLDIVDKEFNYVKSVAIKKFSEYEKNINETLLEFNKNKKKFGFAILSENKIVISVFLCHTPYYIRGTIRHEMAHIVDFLINGSSSHSYEWKRIARHLGLTNPKSKTKPSLTIRKNIKQQSND